MLPASITLNASDGFMVVDKPSKPIDKSHETAKNNNNGPNGTGKSNTAASSSTTVVDPSSSKIADHQGVYKPLKPHIYPTYGSLSNNDLKYYVSPTGFILVSTLYPYDLQTGHVSDPQIYALSCEMRVGTSSKTSNGPSLLGGSPDIAQTPSKTDLSANMASARSSTKKSTRDHFKSFFGLSSGQIQQQQQPQQPQQPRPLPLRATLGPPPPLQPKSTPQSSSSSTVPRVKSPQSTNESISRGVSSHGSTTQQSSTSKADVSQSSTGSVSAKLTYTLTSPHSIDGTDGNNVDNDSDNDDNTLPSNNDVHADDNSDDNSNAGSDDDEDDDICINVVILYDYDTNGVITPSLSLRFGPVGHTLHDNHKSTKQMANMKTSSPSSLVHTPPTMTTSAKQYKKKNNGIILDDNIILPAGSSTHHLNKNRSLHNIHFTLRSYKAMPTSPEEWYNSDTLVEFNPPLYMPYFPMKPRPSTPQHATKISVTTPTQSSSSSSSHIPVVASPVSSPVSSSSSSHAVVSTSSPMSVSSPSLSSHISPLVDDIPSDDNTIISCIESHIYNDQTPQSDSHQLLKTIKAYHHNKYMASCTSSNIKTSDVTTSTSTSSSTTLVGTNNNNTNTTIHAVTDATVLPDKTQDTSTNVAKIGGSPATSSTTLAKEKGLYLFRLPVHTGADLDTKVHRSPSPSQRKSLVLSEQKMTMQISPSSSSSSSSLSFAPLKSSHNTNLGDADDDDDDIRNNQHSIEPIPLEHHEQHVQNHRNDNHQPTNNPATTTTSNTQAPPSSTLSSSVGPSQQLQQTQNSTSSKTRSFFSSLKAIAVGASTPVDSHGVPQRTPASKSQIAPSPYVGPSSSSSSAVPQKRSVDDSNARSNNRVDNNTTNTTTTNNNTNNDNNNKPPTHNSSQQQQPSLSQHTTPHHNSTFKKTHSSDSLDPGLKHSESHLDFDSFMGESPAKSKQQSHHGIQPRQLTYSPSISSSSSQLPSGTPIGDEASNTTDGTTRLKNSKLPPSLVLHDAINNAVMTPSRTSHYDHNGDSPRSTRRSINDNHDSNDESSGQLDDFQLSDLSLSGTTLGHPNKNIITIWTHSILWLCASINKHQYLYKKAKQLRNEWIAQHIEKGFDNDAINDILYNMDQNKTTDIFNYPEPINFVTYTVSPLIPIASSSSQTATNTSTTQPHVSGKPLTDTSSHEATKSSTTNDIPSSSPPSCLEDELILKQASHISFDPVLISNVKSIHSPYMNRLESLLTYKQIQELTRQKVENDRKLADKLKSERLENERIKQLKREQKVALQRLSNEKNNIVDINTDSIKVNIDTSIHKDRDDNNQNTNQGKQPNQIPTNDNSDVIGSMWRGFTSIFSTEKDPQQPTTSKRAKNVATNDKMVVDSTTSTVQSSDSTAVAVPAGGDVSQQGIVSTTVPSSSGTVISNTSDGGVQPPGTKILYPKLPQSLPTYPGWLDIPAEFHVHHTAPLPLTPCDPASFPITLHEAYYLLYDNCAPLSWAAFHNSIKDEYWNVKSSEWNVYNSSIYNSNALYISSKSSLVSKKGIYTNDDLNAASSTSLPTVQYHTVPSYDPKLKQTESNPLKFPPSFSSGNGFMVPIVNIKPISQQQQPIVTYDSGPYNLSSQDISTALSLSSITISPYNLAQQCKENGYPSPWQNWSTRVIQMITKVVAPTGPPESRLLKTQRIGLLVAKCDHPSVGTTPESQYQVIGIEFDSTSATPDVPFGDSFKVCEKWTILSDLSLEKNIPDTNTPVNYADYRGITVFPRVSVQMLKSGWKIAAFVSIIQSRARSDSARIIKDWVSFIRRGISAASLPTTTEPSSHLRGPPLGVSPDSYAQTINDSLAVYIKEVCYWPPTLLPNKPPVVMSLSSASSSAGVVAGVNTTTANALPNNTDVLSNESSDITSNTLESSDCTASTSSHGTAHTTTTTDRGAALSSLTSQLDIFTHILPHLPVPLTLFVISGVIGYLSGSQQLATQILLVLLTVVILTRISQLENKMNK